MVFIGIWALFYKMILVAPQWRVMYTLNEDLFDLPHCCTQSGFCGETENEQNMFFAGMRQYAFLFFCFVENGVLRPMRVLNVAYEHCS